ncbi:hypothetical protein [Actinophytocola sp.]|uniref:hypothetical protein n=1 Tax=Actinophytocola sp. TaxID=1872138 RepID=UPI002ED43E6B
MGDELSLSGLRQELLDRGHTHASIADVDDVTAALEMLGMDVTQPWHDVRLHFAAEAEHTRTVEDGIRGSDPENALANARWNWPSALRIEHVGMTPCHDSSRRSAIQAGSSAIGRSSRTVYRRPWTTESGPIR